MAQTRYPLRVIHRYTLRREELAGVAAALSRLGPESLSRMAAVPARRREALPLVALTLRRLLAVARPDDVVFSAYGLREGLLQVRLAEPERRDDPLIVACRKIALREGRFAESTGAFHGWMEGLFAADDPRFSRLRRAACLLSDIAWAANPDKRAADAFHWIMNMPTLAVDHAGRATIALALHARYGGAAKDAAAAYRLAAAAAADRAAAVGLALRLGYAITGGAGPLLAGCALTTSGDTLTLTLRGAAAALDTALVNRRLEALAQALGHTPRLETVPG
jgi:exopolyphosphatase/guanosine-5'-triphosphate,3'-diphosphate pyrophosphatase